MKIRNKISDQQWNRLKDLLPAENAGKRGRPTERSNRQMMDGIVWILRTGAPWRDLPAEFGPWQSVYTRFRRWKEKGIWGNVFEALSLDSDNESVMIDSSVIRAHQHAAGAKGGRMLRH